ncbi:MAG: hypothetical protein GX100_07160, partial [candidate division WS1 bacterium]|nr:hypothetical protein [candidate division WS1 bacterium]
RGPLKVLFLANYNMGAREVVELKQRLNMEIDVTLYQSPRMQLGVDDSPYVGAVLGTSRAEKLAVLYEQLEQKWDAFVMGANTPFADLSPKAQYLMLKQVSEGAGLICLGALPKEALNNPTEDDPYSILAGVPFPLLKSYTLVPKMVPLEKLPEDLLKTYTLGQGRVAMVKHYVVYPYPRSLEGYYQGFQSLTPAFPYSYKEHVYYDYYLSAIAKTLLWAVPSKASVITPAPENEMFATVNWADLPRTVPVGRFNLPAGKTLSCKAELRDLFGKITPLAAPEVSGGNYELAVQMPTVPQGDYFVDYQLTSPEGTEYWGSYGVAVRAELPTIDKIQMAEVMYQPTAPFFADVRLSAAPPPGLILRARGFDRVGREIFRVDRPATREVVPVGADLERTVGMAHHLRAELWQGDRCVDVAREEFLVTAREDPLWANIIWGDPINTLLGEMQNDQMRRAGFNVSLTHDPARPATRDFREIDYLIALRFPAVTDEDPDPGFDNPQWVEDYVAKSITAPVLKKRDYGVWYYSLGDENSYSYSRAKIAPSELRAWRQYLNDTYGGDLALLNREWNSEHKSFDEISWVNVEEPLEMVDIPRKHLWMAFCEKQYADAHHAMAEAIREVDPEARVGAEGSLPGNLEETLKGLQMWGPYPSRLDNALMRSFETTPLLKGNWWGGYVSGRSSGSQKLWDQILTGGVNSSYYYTMYGSEGFIGADMSYADFFEQTQQADIREVTDTLGPLLNATPVAKMGLGLFYSLPSEHAGTIDTRWGAVGSCRDGMLKFCEQTGISSHFYSEKQILAGKLDADGVTVLMMPQALCVSEAVAQALRQWVAAGGVLIADQRPGLRNERAALREKGVLDELFGVAQTVEGDPQVTTVQVPGQAWERVIVDASLKPATATKGMGLQSDLPVGLVNQVGTGRAILLNISLGKLLANYDDDATRNFLREMLKQGGIFTGLQAPPGYLLTRFEGPGYQLLSCRITTEGKANETVKLGETVAAYDVRSGKYLGKVDSLVPSQCAGRNNLFALLPEPATGISVQAPGKAEAGAMLAVTVSTRATAGKSNPTRLVMVKWLTPEGVEVEVLRKYASVSEEPARVILPLALNQASGTYTCEVTDILTGQVQTARVEVTGGNE